MRDYPDFTLTVTEVHPDGQAVTAAFRCHAAFRQEVGSASCPSDGVLLDEDTFRVRALILDHKIPCLAFALEEKTHVNVWKTGLAAMGLPTGSWLRELKEAVVRGEPEDTPFRVWWRDGAMIREKQIPLRVLRENLLSIVPGQKIAYVADAAYHAENARRIVGLARGSDLLFIETPFLHEGRPDGGGQASSHRVSGGSPRP